MNFSLLQRRFTAGTLLCEFDLGHGDQDFGAGLEIGRFQQGLFLRLPKAHHGERVDQRLIGAFSIPCQSALSLLAFRKPERARNSLRDRLCLRPCVPRNRRRIEVAHAALPVGRRYFQLILDAKARYARELHQIAAVTTFGQLRDASDTAYAIEVGPVFRSRMRRVGLESCR